MEKNRTNSEFWDAVKKRLKINLACWKLDDNEIEDYMKQEEDQIKGAYKGYSEDSLGCVRDGSMTNEASFQAEVCAVSYCLEMCYE